VILLEIFLNFLWKSCTIRIQRTYLFLLRTFLASALFQERIHGGRSLSLKSTKVTLFTVVFYNLENSIRDIRPFCRPLFFHSSDVKYSLLYPAYSSEAVTRHDYEILLKSPPPKLTRGIRPWSLLTAM